jgi:hypothetical protein
MSPHRRASRAVAALLVAFLLVQTAMVPVLAVPGVDRPTARSTTEHPAVSHSLSQARVTPLAPTAGLVTPSTAAGVEPTRPSAFSDRRPLERPLGVDRRAARTPVIDGNYTFVPLERDGVVRLRMQYDLPPSVTAFHIRLPGLATSAVSFASNDGFDRHDETTFVWTRSTSTPALDLRLAVSSDSISRLNRGIERDGWTFATAPRSEIGFSYTGARPRFVSTTGVVGNGYAADRMAFMGPHDVTETTVGGEAVTFVVGNGTEKANLTAVRTFLELSQGRFDFGVDRDRLVVFVLPFDGRSGEATQPLVTGEASGDAFWVTAGATNVTGPENAFAHEYVHSRLGTVGNGSAAWLTEATAEYYGYLSTLNAGGSSYESFYRATTAERYAPNRSGVVLADRETWRGTLGDYEKGAHVLAALDAEIRERTDGDHTLYDVFVANRTFDDYAAFRAQVVATANDESLGPWLDRYVTTDALPPVPDEPARYVHGPDLDPDGDGIVSREEVRTTPPTNPFVADTDGDGLSDAREREVGTNPLRPDTDGDTLSDAHEVAARTDPTSADTDDDGTNDAIDPYPTDPSIRTERTETDSDDRTATTTGPSEPAETASRPGETATAVGRDATPGEKTDERTGVGDDSRTEVPGFGAVAVAAAVVLVGMLLRRENRDSS